MSDRIFELIEENDISIIEEPSLETFDTLFSLENPGDTDEKTKDEIETLQQELRQANRESQKQQKKIDKLLKNRNSEPGAELSLDEVPGKRGEQGSSNNDQSVEQFKQQISNGRIKIKKLQNIIREKQNSIQGLKKASKELIFKEMDVSELDSLHEEEYIPLPETSRKVHIPQYSNGFRKTLSTVNPSLARHALQAFTGFTTGDPKYLKQTKTLKTVDNHFSIRIGIHYRLIFEYISGTPPLAKYLIHRKDLEMQLKKM